MSAPTWLRPARSLRRALIAVALAMVLVHGTVAPAGAGAPDWTKVRVSARGSCPGDELYVNPEGRVFLQELGKSSVVGFKAQFRLYRTNVGAGWNSPRLEKTYASPTFPNDARNFWVNLPTNGVHRWTEVYATNSYRLNVKVVWDRGRWRRDWVYDTDVAWCR